MTVYLVGAGPGDPGLVTVRARELLGRADVVLYDLLIGPEILGWARDDAELVFVGKRGGGEQVPQEETNRLLVEHGQAGRTVVRLKGGDPFVFGRGSEEAQVLREAGVAYEVVPGITAGIAAPAYAGVPVTHRDIAAGVAFITGSRAELDWEALARFPGTLVFYMGVRALPRIAEGLIGGGRSADEPVAIVERGTMSGQRTTHATLGTVTEAEVSAPAVIVVGPVAALGEELAWRELRPLHGVRVAVTRARAQASPLAARLRDLGAEVVEAPAIRTRSLETELPPLDAFDLVVVSSPNGAAELFRRVRDARALAGLRVAAMGPGTARALREGGIAADIVPDRSVAEGMVEALADLELSRVLVVRAKEGREVLPDALRERGVDVEVVALYETLAEPVDPGGFATIADVDWITFTSASTVRFLGDIPAGPRLASIGPATSEALREAGREPDLEADPHTPDGLVDALVAAAVRH